MFYTCKDNSCLTVNLMPREFEINVMYIDCAVICLVVFSFLWPFTVFQPLCRFSLLLRYSHLIITLFLLKSHRGQVSYLQAEVFRWPRKICPIWLLPKLSRYSICYLCLVQCLVGTGSLYPIVFFGFSITCLFPGWDWI